MNKFMLGEHTILWSQVVLQYALDLRFARQACCDVVFAIELALQLSACGLRGAFRFMRIVTILVATIRVIGVNM